MTTGLSSGWYEQTMASLILGGVEEIDTAPSDNNDNLDDLDMAVGGDMLDLYKEIEGVVGGVDGNIQVTVAENNVPFMIIVGEGERSYSASTVNKKLYDIFGINYNTTLEDDDDTITRRGGGEDVVNIGDLIESTEYNQIDNQINDQIKSSKELGDYDQYF